MVTKKILSAAIALTMSVLPMLADDSIRVSSADLQALIRRVERLEAAAGTAQKAASESPKMTTAGKKAEANTVDATTGATKKVDATTGATVKQEQDAGKAEEASKQERKVFEKGHFTVGGYGEAVMTRNFYSDHFNRYLNPSKYADAKSNGQFDLPHVVINLGYDFGHGWSMGTEIEFEHGGTESAVEVDADEAGEYEAEVEKGGEVALEQFWIQKSWMPLLNLRMGEIIVPVGMTNSHHMPTEFFTCYRNEGEKTLFPCTWHQIGVSLWGKNDYVGYEVQLLSGLDAERFSAVDFVHYGATSPYEFKIANGYAFAGRVDGYIPNTGLRLSASGYVGTTLHNTQSVVAYNADYDSIYGTLAIGSFDFEWQKFGIIMRGNVDYAHLSNSTEIWNAFQNLSKHNQQDGSPRTGQPVSEGALCGGIQLGFDIFHYVPAVKEQKFIPFVLYEYYNPVFQSKYDIKYDYMNRHRIAAGINYYPIPEVVIKAEYSHRFLPTTYNNEPSVSLSVAYCGWFHL